MVAVFLCAAQVSALAQIGRGIVGVSVCPLHPSADYATPVETQLLMGMEVEVLDSARWLRVKAPDGYVAWAHRDCIALRPADVSAAWDSLPHLVVTVPWVQVTDTPRANALPVTDVVAGCRLALLRKGRTYLHVLLPDGRNGWLPRNAACDETRWKARMCLTGESVARYALTLLGVPYVWGGTSTKGVDCSGLVSQAWLMHGAIIPRNASQQARLGRWVDTSGGWDSLQPGDLLFFGMPAGPGRKERVTHVAISLGGSRFVHSQAYVRIGSLDPSDPQYDAFNHRRFLYVRRLLE